MALDPAVKAVVARKLEEYEGRYPHLYLDTKGKVTVGVGHMIPNRDAIALVPFYLRSSESDSESSSGSDSGDPGTPATTAQKQQEYDRVHAQKRNYRAAWYQQLCKLVMSDTDIDAQRDRHITVFYQELRIIYRQANGYPLDFDQMPAVAQLALFDMIFNLGATKLQKLFVKFNAALKEGDWIRAGEESNRPDVSPRRNSYVKQLFDNAHQLTSNTTS